MPQLENHKNFLLEFVDSKDTPEDEYSLALEHIVGDIYTDGGKYYEITESSIYMIEAKRKSKKKKKVKVARRKGSTLILSTKKDKVVFNPDAVVMNSGRTF